MKKYRNRTIDLLKVIFSICIIGIHLNLFKETNFTLFRVFTQGLFRLGVPFYFITSGYYFGGKLEDKNKAKKYILRLIKIYAVFECVDILLNILVIKGIWNRGIGYILWKISTTGMNGIYWYLVSLIYTCLLCFPLWKRGYVKYLMMIGLILYMIVMTNDSYSFMPVPSWIKSLAELHTTVWRWHQAGLAESVLYCSVGVYLRQKEYKSVNHIVLLISLVCLVIEALWTQSFYPKDANCYFSLLIAAPLLFLWALKKESAIIYHPYFADMSVYIYMVHIYMNYVSYIFSQGDMRFVISAILSVMVAFMIIKFSERRKNNSL